MRKTEGADLLPPGHIGLSAREKKDKLVENNRCFKCMGIYNDPKNHREKCNLLQSSKNIYHNTKTDSTLKNFIMFIYRDLSDQNI